MSLTVKEENLNQLLFNEFLKDTPALKDAVDYYMPCKEFGEFLLKKLNAELIQKRDFYLGSWVTLKKAGINYKNSQVFAVLEFIENELLGGDASKYI